MTKRTIRATRGQAKEHREVEDEFERAVHEYFAVLEYSGGSQKVPPIWMASKPNTESIVGTKGNAVMLHRCSCSQGSRYIARG